MSQPVRTTSPNGEAIVILSAADYDRLVSLAEDTRDARIAGKAVEAYRSDPTSALTSEEMRALLAAPTPLAFWRRRRGLSQAALAAKIGCSQPYLQNLEAGKRRGTLPTFRLLAKALDLTVDDLDPTSGRE